MSFKEWLYDQLCNDGVIDEYEVDADDVTEEMLLTSTDVEEEDYHNYKEQFVEHCRALGVSAIWDVE